MYDWPERHAEVDVGWAATGPVGWAGQPGAATTSTAPAGPTGAGTPTPRRFVTRVDHVPYVVEQDEDGVWCASAQLRPGVGAVGDGPTAEAAVAGLRDVLEALLAEVGPPDELTLTLDVA